jgi:hypothetical protein
LAAARGASAVLFVAEQEENRTGNVPIPTRISSNGVFIYWSFSMIETYVLIIATAIGQNSGLLIV